MYGINFSSFSLVPTDNLTKPMHRVTVKNKDEDYEQYVNEILEHSYIPLSRDLWEKEWTNQPKGHEPCTNENPLVQ
ncbi:Hypothetical protein CINCED_3A011180 [Cinara cedri]|uniref:Uncharacterized protein n=1 Tax=Cinara cedri TaxID=506608 RepID=A0A5E4NED5_9HEMI|nr:Hypothetical protein CINCED_3A011180 [Cinara cedri]